MKIAIGCYYNKTLFDSDYQTNVLDVAQTAGFALPRYKTLQYQNRLMKDNKNIGFYQVQDTLANFTLGSVGYEQFGMVDWKKTGNIYTPYGGLIYNPEGIQGNGVNAYVDTNFNGYRNGVNYQLNDAGRYVVVNYSVNDLLSPPNLLDGLSAANNINTLYNMDSNAQRINNSNVLLSQTADLSGIGFKSIIRYDSINISFINKSVAMHRIQPSSTVTDSNQLILSRGDGRCGYPGISIYSIGASISFSMAQQFRIIFNQYLSNIGLAPVA